MSKRAVVLFTRDLRLHDQPALAAAVDCCDGVLPLFVLDDRVLSRMGAPNRVAFLLDALHDLRRSLETRGGGLAIRRGDVVAETVRFALEHDAGVVHVSEDVSAYAQERERRLEHALAGARLSLETFPGVTVVPPGELVPTGGGDHFRVFTPYWRRWRDEPRRAALPAPERISAPDGVEWGRIPERGELTTGTPAPDLAEGGEAAGRQRLAEWLRDGLSRYATWRDDLAADATSGLSPYLHFGCVSPTEVVERSLDGDGEEFVRQLCWRDFHYQLLAANPSLAHTDMRPRGAAWRTDEEALQAWKEGRTGYPVVDAGMRQLLREGWMHNRARLVAGSFLTKHLGIDWRAGAAHFFEHLVDGDVASNVGNWQWVAGTGADSRPYRMLSPARQAQRFDPHEIYVRRYVPEYGTQDYPEPIVVHEEAVARFRKAAA